MNFRFLLGLIHPYRIGLAILMALSLAEAGVTLIVPLFAGRLGAVFLAPSSQVGGVGLILAAILGLLALTAGLQALSAVVYARSAETIMADLRQRIFDHMLALPLPWHQRQERGNLMALATLEVERLGHFVTGTLVSMLPLLMTAAGAVLVMLSIDPALALLAPLLVPAFYIMTRLLGRLLRGIGQQIQEEEADTATRVEEMLELIPALKSFTAEPVERRAHALGIARLKALSIRQARIYAITSPTMQFAVSASVAVLLVLVGERLQSGKMDAAQTISFLMYVVLLVRPVSELASVYGEVQTVRGTLMRLQTVLSERPEPPAAGPPFPTIRGDIRFEDVHFAYPDRGAALEGMNFHVRQGETVALTGPNGAGKSTAINLLLGFQRPSSGRILLDGQDITLLPPDHLRRAIGYVPQTRHLRNATVRENIIFGQKGPDQRDIDVAQVEAAARIAQAHDFILTLPQGYDTPIGDRGLRLSGGQQQRIALARALLCDPPIMVLDEATSMFDLEGEAAFISECHEALRGRTVILITHRPASLAIADRVLRINAGRIVTKEEPQR